MVSHQERSLGLCREDLRDLRFQALGPGQGVGRGEDALSEDVLEGGRNGQHFAELAGKGRHLLMGVDDRVHILPQTIDRTMDTLLRGWLDLPFIAEILQGDQHQLPFIQALVLPSARRDEEVG